VSKVVSALKEATPTNHAALAAIRDFSKCKEDLLHYARIFDLADEIFHRYGALRSLAANPPLATHRYGALPSLAANAP
jgi:hypothetical protein